MIQYKNIFFTYETEIEKTQETSEYILTDFSFTVKKGMFLGILGANGSGKSTLAKLTNGLLLPTKGDIYIEGLNTKDKTNLLEIRKKIGIVFQNPENQIIMSKVDEDIAFGPEYLGIECSEIEQRIEQSLIQVSMLDKKSHETYTLSGGQKQHISIAGILAMKPSYIIFDESTAMLNPEARRKMVQMANELNKNHNITIIFITHFIEELIEADEIIVIQNGKICLQGKPKDIYTEIDTMKELSLEVPIPTELAHELKVSGLPIRTNIFTEEELIEELCQFISIT